MATRVCARCGETKEEERFRRSFGDARKNVCKSCQAVYEHTRIKLDMLEALGGKCACCGETNPLFLALDHVKNNGGEHRRQTHYQTHQTRRYARRLGWPKDEFQLLCHNCNFSKGHFGRCPHQTGQTTEVVLSEMQAVVATSGKRYRNFQELHHDLGFVERRPEKSQEMRGNKYARRKLSPEQVREIRAMRESGSTQIGIAKCFGISREAVRKILDGRTWSSLR